MYCQYCCLRQYFQSSNKFRLVSTSITHSCKFPCFCTKNRSLGRRFLVRAGGDRGLLVSFLSFDVKSYPADKWRLLWGQHQDFVSLDVISFCLLFWCRVYFRAAWWIRQPTTLVNSDQSVQNQNRRCSLGLFFRLSGMWGRASSTIKSNFSSFNFHGKDDQTSQFPSTRYPQDHNINERNQEEEKKKKNKTAPISNPSSIVC